MGADTGRSGLAWLASLLASKRARVLRTRSVRLVFGDALGVLLFTGALLYLGLWWRFGILINDNWTVANTLVAVTQGHLAFPESLVTDPVYGPPGVQTPGLRIIDGQVYGRSYGRALLSLPLFVALKAVTLVADLSIALAGAWSLLLVAFSLRLVSWFDDHRYAKVGSVVALLVFVANAVVAQPIPARLHYLLALQLGTMLAAALTGVVVYRLLEAIYDRRTGLLVGVATVAATPVAFWAPFPKRHVLVALLATVTLFSFYTSRTVEADSTALWSRCLAYASIGLAAWVYPAEPLVLLVALVPLDLATARSNDPRRLLVVGVVFFLSLVPFFVTNQLVTGHPLVPPVYDSIAGNRMEPIGGVTTPTPGGGVTTPTVTQTPTPVTTTASPTASPSPITGGTPTSGGTAVPDGSPPPTNPTTPQAGASPSVPTPAEPSVDIGQYLSTIVAVISSAEVLLSTLLDFFSRGWDIARADPSRLYHTYVRSAPSVSRFEMTDLSLLEATPALGLLAGLPLAAIVRWRSWLQAKNPFSDPICQTDLLAGAYVLGLSLFYLQALPVNATWTVRYLLPTVPFGLYFVARLPPVRHVVHEAPRLLAYAWTVQVLVGGQFVLLYLLSINATRGEVVRFHALLGILAAAVGAVWVVLALLDLVDDARVGAVALSVPLAAGTLYYLLAGLEYFVVGPFALGLVEALSRAIPLF